MGKTKRQHYVPRTYLKRFSFDGIRIHSFLIKKSKSFLTDNELSALHKDISISDVCVAQNYYTIDESNSHNNRGLKKMYLEKDFFQDYAEPLLSTTIANLEKLVQSFRKEGDLIESVRFSERLFRDIALCAFIQYYRSPRQRHDIEIVNSLLKHIHTQSIKEHRKPDDSEFKGLDVAFMQANKGFMNPFLWRMFYRKILSYCMLLRVSGNENFFTSDNPVVIHKLGAKGKDILNVNIYQDEFSLFFPLLPNLILEYYNPVFFPDAINMDRTISMVDKNYENQVNKYQYVNAEKFVFSYKNDFSLFLKPIINTDNHGEVENAKS